MWEMPRTLGTARLRSPGGIAGFCNSLRLPVFPNATLRQVSGAKATLPWRDQLALEPAYGRFGLHGITELHRCLDYIRAARAFKSPKVIA